MVKKSQRILTRQTPSHIDENVLIQGWVNSRRDHGKLIFFDIRDRSGLVQVVFHPNSAKDFQETASLLRPEDVVAIEERSINVRKN